MAKLSNDMLRKIYASARELNLDNDLIHSFVLNMTGSEHISALTKSEAIMIIDELEYKKTGVRKKTPYRANMATEDQIFKIKALEKSLGWSSNPKRLKAFTKKYSGIEELKWLTFAKASKLIESLKKILEKNNSKNF